MSGSTNVNNWMKVSIKGIIGILIYYCILFALGVFITFNITILSNLDTSYLAQKNVSYIFLINDTSPKLNYQNVALVGALGSSLLGSSIYYIRKLYKLCIEKRFTEPDESNHDKMQNLGTLIYFLLRPFFAIAFALLVVAGIQTSMISLTNEKIQLSNNFPNLCIFISFFIGFSSGKFLKSLEMKADSIINNIMQDKPENKST